MVLTKKMADQLSKQFEFQSQSVTAIPPLESGDRLTRDEFERRYEAMPRLKKAELIEGVVYTHPFVPFAHHGEPHAKIAGWIGTYCVYTPGTDSGNNSTVRLDSNNEPQPDVTLFIDAVAGGNARIDEDDFISGPPELIAEVAVSSASYDLRDKLEVYRRNGVREYIVWTAHEAEIHWFRLHDEKYVKMRPDKKGIIRSHIFPGLHLAVDALLIDDIRKVMTELQNGLSSKAHATFTKKLATAASKKLLKGESYNLPYV